MEVLTIAMQNYLETIYELSGEEYGARVSDIASRLGVSKASVNSAVNVLAKNGLVENEKYQDIKLTTYGRNMAFMLSGKHKILNCLLKDVIGVDEKTADADSCEMEHVISQASIQGIYEFLKKQGFDPLAPKKI